MQPRGKGELSGGLHGHAPLLGVLGVLQIIRDRGRFESARLHQIALESCSYLSFPVVPQTETMCMNGEPSSVSRQ